ncbi:MAG TPA: ATP-binding protein [Pyrinomonadaceae bacterium]|jgi:signal transduction histidine kinase|nr:ATP-binding protein [Pyrinomonadaceae bacterium]
MQIPETPSSVVELDLMRRLDGYANGSASWLPGESAIGESAKQACRTLHTNLTNLVNRMFAFILDRVTAREMETFTMHDRVHGRKVAHLMWHILKPERRERLTPPEIGILIVAAHLHDLGMGLSPVERAERLAPESDLWDKLELQDSVRVGIEKLRAQIGDPDASDSVKRRAQQELFQAEEALLTQDTRERHAKRERYEEIINLLAEFHQRNPVQVPDIMASLSFDGFSFLEKVIDVCMSHNEDADALVSNDEKNFDRPRFPTNFPVGCCEADLHTVAAALRLADILDFDRERTPAVLFHYLLPGTLGGLENRSILEWSKHLAISNWHIDKDAVIFRGRSESHIIHHAVVQFCSVIADEIKATHATFSPLGETSWPFILPQSVKADIHEEGYRYVPYKFELDDDRVYSLLMGGAIYDDPLVAVRELVQNAVDACKLRDSLTRLYEDHAEPGKVNRIFIRYEEPTAQCPQARLIVRDTGTGMDAYTLERYFLQVGRSYYNSSDFNQIRVQLRKNNLDFAPISEFGIGFLSSFLLADHLQVETAIWESPRGDTAKRTLTIDGPTRLIRLNEQRNDGFARFKGTQITLFLVPKVSQNKEFSPASWEEIKDYLKEVCQDLPYSLNLEYVVDGNVVKEQIAPLPLTVKVPHHLESATVRIPVNDKEAGLEGEIALINQYVIYKLERALIEDATVKATPSSGDKVIPAVVTKTKYSHDSALLRGGFKIDQMVGLPRRYNSNIQSGARLRLTWNSRTDKRYLKPNLARNGMSNNWQMISQITRIWLTYCLKHTDELPEELLWEQNIPIVMDKFTWLEEFDALMIYRLAKRGWLTHLREQGISDKDFESWEKGKGDALWFNHDDLNRDLLDLIMPRVTNLQLRGSGIEFINPPRPDWLSVLATCRDYITSPVQWGAFVEYTGEIRDLLLYGDLNSTVSLNSRYQDRFASWDQKEMVQLRVILDDFIESLTEGEEVSLTPSEMPLFRRAVEVAGDLRIGTTSKSWTLDSFGVAEV